MEIKGKIHKMLPVQSGESKNGSWKKQEFVIETQGQYPKKVCFSMWGDKVDQLRFNGGEEVNVHFDVESREYNGRWYTDAKAWKVELSADEPAGMPPQADFPTEPPPMDEGGDDLPF